MTDKDRSDLEAALDAGVDWIALSFVQRPEDIAEVSKVAQGKALVMAKLEKPQALARLDEIMEVSDALMVARGDLGVEMPLEKVPGLQKRIVRGARRLGKPVVVATQMLEMHDHRAGPDPCRGVGRRDRRLRGRRRGHAVGRERLGPVPDRGGRHHEPDRRGGGAATPSTGRSSPPSATRRRPTGLRRHRGGRPPDRRHARASRRSAPGPTRARPPSASPASGRTPRSSP